MKRKQLNKTEIRELNQKLLASYGKELISKKDAVEIIDDSLITINKQSSFFLLGQTFVPTLKILQREQLLKTVTVDMGAVKFVASGADVMRPGIVNFDRAIRKDDFVVVMDMNNKKPIAVCQSLYSAEDLRNISSGKVLRNIHHVSDSIWNIT